MSNIEIMDIQEIMSMLPHRYPILLVDRIIDIKPGESAIGIKNVTFNEPHFMGHFPGRPIMPGVLIVEAMAQTAAAIIFKSLDGAADGKLVYFMSIEEAKFRKPVTPGDRLEMHIKILKNKGNICKFEGIGMVDGVKVAESIFTAMIVDK
jgi:3-hydroxyacyl-[acyl-carrier-protein] dehydratase